MTSCVPQELLAIGTLRFILSEACAHLHAINTIKTEQLAPQTWITWPARSKPSLPKGDPTLIEALQYACDCHVAVAEFWCAAIGSRQTSHSSGISGKAFVVPLDMDLKTEETEELITDEDGEAGSPMVGGLKAQETMIVRLYLVPEDIEGRRTIRSLPPGRARTCRKLVYRLLRAVDSSPTRWHLDDDSFRMFDEAGLYAYEPVHVGLAELYQSMPSPIPVVLENRGNSADAWLVNQSQLLAAPKGMKTHLFTYQRNTLWKLLQREILPQRVLDPDMLECRTADEGRRYWLRISTGQVYKHPTYYEEAKGGIICEDMGTGKTCICIALILHTRHQISEPPIDCLGGTVRTDLNRHWLRLVDGDSSDVPKVAMPPSLKQLAVVNIIKYRTPFRHKKNRLPDPLYKLLRFSPPYYLKKAHQSVRISRSAAEPQPPVKIYLSSSTLVIVPDTLVDQWRMELNKHVEDRVIKLLVLKDKNDTIPSAMELGKYDVSEEEDAVDAY
ncbi:hypothetical protein SpCBS45565_g05782 [Spizellomyces sp. 'palustris']|nr:hypothetical protein SpCBS45565_g05782 [Spizellomyces sp. 'palustris']